MLPTTIKQSNYGHVTNLIIGHQLQNTRLQITVFTHGCIFIFWHAHIPKTFLGTHLPMATVGRRAPTGAPAGGAGNLLHTQKILFPLGSSPSAGLDRAYAYRFSPSTYPIGSLEQDCLGVSVRVMATIVDAFFTTDDRGDAAVNQQAAL